MRLLKPLGLAATLGAVLLHYLWTASSTGNPFRFGGPQDDYYNLLCDGFLRGQLHLPVEPHPELLRLPNPYDPVANAPYRVHDLSLYDRKYYLYFGVTPALTLFIPFRLLLGMLLPEGFAVALLLFGGLAFSLSSFRLLLCQSRSHAGAGFLLVGIVLFGLSNFAPFVLRRPAVYEVAVSSGFFFSSGALYWLLCGIEGQRPRQSFLALASLFLGLAAGSRPHHLLAGPFLLAGYVYVVRRPHARGWTTALSLGGPLASCVVALLVYNHARFGAWLEFGQTYILSDSNHPSLTLFSPSYLPSRSFLYFLSPPTIDWNFPFFHLWPSVMPRLPPQGIVLDSISGLMPCVPAAALSILAPFLLRLGTANTLLARATAAILLAAGLVLAAFVSCYLGVSARYFLDFTPFFLLSSALVWSHLHELCAGRRLVRAALHACFGLLVAYGTVVNLAVGLTGYYDLFRKRNLPAYAWIEDRFVPLQRFLLSLGAPRYGTVQLRVRMPLRTDAAEALLSVGTRGRADVVCVRYQQDGGARLRFRREGTAGAAEARALLAAGRTYRIDVFMGSLLPGINPRALARVAPGLPEDAHRRLSVKVDGKEVMSGLFDFAAAPPESLSLGSNPIDPVHCGAPFSGEIELLGRSLGSLSRDGS